MYKTVDAFMESVISKNPGQDEFHQAVQEVVESIWGYLQEILNICIPKYWTVL